MIYFFDNDLQLQKVTTGQNILLAQHEHELNNLIRADVAVDLSYAKSFINDVDHFGYYYKDVFYLHKIQSVEDDHANELLIISGRHIFFDDMLFGTLIRDVRPQNREAKFMLDQTVGNHTRWNVIMTDVTGTLSTNFYWVPPFEALEWITENFRLEYLPVILFDGQNINGYQLHVKKRIGEQKRIRIPWGERVEQLTHEIDYSEIITKLSVRGKGEEVGDGYGRRIHIGGVNFSRNGVVSPSGSRYLEDPDITATYGNDGQTPREGDVTFEDIEVVSELVEAGYQHYLDVSRPQVLISADVAQIGDVAIGDGVLIIRREHEMYFEARVHKLSVDLLNQEDAQIELGDYDHFKETKVERRTRQNNERVERELSSRIQQLKLDFDYRFDGEVNQMREDFEQALIDAHAEIQAAEERMEALISTTRNDWTDTFDAEVAEIYRKADEDYNRIETEITGVIDSTRNEMEMNFNADVQSAREYAEQQAAERADAVRTDLETVTSGHQNMLIDLESNVMDIDDFLGPRDRTLQSILDEQRLTIEEKIEIYNRAYPNLLVGTSLGNITGFIPWQDSEIELREDESLSYIRTYPGTANQSGYEFPDFVYLEQGKTYTIGIDFRSENVEDLDYIYFLGRYNNVAFTPLSQTRGLTADGTWHRYYFTFDWINTSREAKVMIATNFNVGDMDRDWFDTRQAHIYEGDAHDIPWSPSASDNNQVVNQLLYEVRQLDDGMQTLASRTELDLLTDEFTTFTNEYIETSDRVERTIQEHDNWFEANGARMEMTADGFEQQVWLSDVGDIQPNLIPMANFDYPQSRDFWSGTGGNATAVDSDGFYVYRSTNSGTQLGIFSPYFDLKSGYEYIFSVLVKDHSNVNVNYHWTALQGENTNFLGTPDRQTSLGNGIYRNEYIFTAENSGLTRIRIGAYVISGNDLRIRIKEPKIERGNVRTPFMNSFSAIEQTAEEIRLAVQGIDGYGFLSQSDIQIRSNYVQLGSQRIDGDNLGSLLRVSPSGIDAVAEAMRLSGDLYVDGDITTIAVDAIEGNFARLWAAEFSAITIDVDDISGLTARFEYLYTLNANIERLVSQNVFADGVTALVGNFVDVNAGNIVTSGLSANVIKTSHLDADTTMVRKLFATTARIDELITRNHYVDNVKTLSIDAIHADLRSVNSEIMTSNIIKSNWLNVDTALFNRFTASSAFISSLTSKSAFIRDIQAIEITANQLNLTTLTNRINQIEGGLRITRTDGVDWVRNGQARGHVPVQIFDSYSADEVGFTGLNFYTGSSHWQTFKYFYTPHEGTRLRITWAVGLHEGPSTIEYMEVRARNFSSYSPINSGVGTSSRRVTIRQGETTYVTQDVSMPPPNYNEMAAYLEFRRAPDGQSINNVVRARILHIGQYE